MPLRQIPIRRVGSRDHMLLGGDRELVLFAGLLAGALIFTAQTFYATMFGLTLWFGSLYVLRLMGKSDPKLRHVYLRHRKYRSYYTARSHPSRNQVG